MKLHNGITLAHTGEGGIEAWVDYNHGPHRLTQKEIVDLFKLASQALSKNPSYPREALLLGGPLHGNIVQIPDGADINCYSYVPPSLQPLGGPYEMPAIQKYRHHSDIAIYDTFLPLIIMEHESLADMNVTLKAKRLDEALEASARMEKLHEGGHKAYAEAQQKSRELHEQRTLLAYEHGV